MDFFTAIMTAIIAGTFTILGAYTASHWHWKTQHNIWLLEKRAEVFKDFWVKLSLSEEEAVQLWRQWPEGVNGMSPEERQAVKRRIADIYQPVFDYGNVVQLFLTESNREEFQRLVREIGVLHGPVENIPYENRIQRRQELIKPRLKTLLEEHISNSQKFENYIVKTWATEIGKKLNILFKRMHE